MKQLFIFLFNMMVMTCVHASSSGVLVDENGEAGHQVWLVLPQVVVSDFGFTSSDKVAIGNDLFTIVETEILRNIANQNQQKIDLTIGKLDRAAATNHLAAIDQSQLQQLDINDVMAMLPESAELAALTEQLASGDFSDIGALSASHLNLGNIDVNKIANQQHYNGITFDAKSMDLLYQKITEFMSEHELYDDISVDSESRQMLFKP